MGFGEYIRNHFNILYSFNRNFNEYDRIYTLDNCDYSHYRVYNPENTGYRIDNTKYVPENIDYNTKKSIKIRNAVAVREIEKPITISNDIKELENEIIQIPISVDPKEYMEAVTKSEYFRGLGIGLAISFLLAIVILLFKVLI